MKINTKRVYEKAEDLDGFRILVDRLWPRGLSKEKAKIDIWLPDIAPSKALRDWFSHDPEKWNEFKKRYFEELDSNENLLKLKEYIKKERITLLYGAKNISFNNAKALEEYIVKRLKK